LVRRTADDNYDPIADMLTRIRNANQAMFDSVAMPGSKLKESLAQILQREGFIESYTVATRDGKPGTTLEIKLKYSEDRKRSIMGIKRISKPGLRIYRSPTRCPRCSAASWVAVVSTGRGLMTDREARLGPARRRGALLCLVTSSQRTRRTADVTHRT
jgi:small subunit ribosomal protein S8